MTAAAPRPPGPLPWADGGLELRLRSSLKPNPPGDVCSVPQAFGSSSLAPHAAKEPKVTLMSRNPFSCWHSFEKTTPEILLPRALKEG